VEVIETPWGEAVPVDAIGDALKSDTNQAFKGVLLVHNETSTGVTSDVAAIRRAIDDAKHPALLYVDGISSVAALDFRMDEWGVDLALASSQKGFMLPPGLGLLGASPRALERVETARAPRAFFDLRDHIADGFMPYTPAMSLLFGLDESLNILLDEGLDAVAARHHRLAEGVRAAVKAWGLSLCARDPRTYSDSVSAVMLPGGEAPRVIERALSRYNLSLAPGQGEVAGKLFRIGHLGDLNELMVLGALSGVEMALADCGLPVEPGSGVARAQESFRAAG
jgi:alanine-glyoxylate transaminase/serine-glyoxylate transaminase/serine-pyruvate transaminase